QLIVDRGVTTCPGGCLPRCHPLTPSLIVRQGRTPRRPARLSFFQHGGKKSPASACRNVDARNRRSLRRRRTLDEKWAKDLLKDELVQDVLCGYLVNRGVDPREARRRAEEAVAEAWNRLAWGEKDYTDYGHFRAAVIKTARN